MKSNIKLKIILITLFTLIYSGWYYLNLQTKNQRINLILNKQIKILKTHYDVTMDYFIQDVKSIRTNISNNKKAIALFKKAQNATKKEKNVLRDKLYILLSPMYKRIHSRGILQWQFVFPNNRSFLRMHKPSKFEDDLTDIRYSFAQVNKTKETIVGFEQGRTTHGFRYVFPYFDKEGNHLGAIEISLSSNSLQDKLLNINKIHSHFLVNKDTFETKEWETKGFTTKYIQSIEHKNYMFSLTEHSHIEILKNSKINIMKPLKDNINKKISLHKPFSVYTIVDNTAKVVTFLPTKNAKKTKVAAYIVSYTNNQNIYNIYYDFNKQNTIRFIGLFILFIFLYKVFKDKEIIDNKKQELEQYLKVIDDINIGIFIVNEDFTIRYMNNTMVKWFGDQSGKICYKSVAGSDEPCPYCKIHEVIKNKKKVQYNPNTPDGQSFDIISAPIHNIDGTISKMEVIRNITAEKKLEEQILKSEKLASMGEMIGNIAHQWRQPLSIISTGATGMLVQKEFGILSDEQFINTCNIINENTQYLSKTIDDFRNFIKGDRTKKEFNLTSNINSFLHLVKGSIKNHDIDIILDLQDDIIIDGYENELTQCLINIFNNAKDILKEQDLKKRLIFITTRKENDHAIIKIKDNAGGIHKDIIHKVFEPYFTTKHQSQGTGIGLHMTYNLIVDGMKGDITTSNKKFEYKGEKYIGAEFKIKL